MDHGSGRPRAHTLTWASLWAAALALALAAGGGCKDEGGGIERTQKQLRKAIAPLARLTPRPASWAGTSLRLFVVRPADKRLWRKRTSRPWSPLALARNIPNADPAIPGQVKVGSGRVELWAVVWDPTGRAEGRGIVLVWYKDGRTYCLPQPRVMSRYPGIKGVGAWGGIWVEPGLGARVLAGLGLERLAGAGRCYGRFSVELRPLKGLRARGDGRIEAVAGGRLLASASVELVP